MKVISLKNIEQFCAPDQRELVLTPGQIITPSAKDLLRNKGIKVIYSQSSKNDTTVENYPTVSLQQCDKEQLIKRITQLVISRYGITDAGELSAIVTKVIKNI